MRKFTLVLLAVGLAACQGPDQSPDQISQKNVSQSENAPKSLGASIQGGSAAIHAKTLTLDTHIDIPLNYMREIDPSQDTDLQVDLPKLAKGQLDSGFWIIYTPQGELTDEGYAQGLEIAETRNAAIHQLTKTYTQSFEIAKTAEDVRRIVAAGKYAVLIGMENAYPLGESIDDVTSWARRGVRYMGITHFGHNQFGDSSNPNPERDNGPKWNGLSPLGKALVRAMNDNGIMVDVSHAGKATMMQAADLSRAPIIASHSGAKAIWDSPRNLDDDQLRKIRDVGGVAQMVALATYVKGLTPAQLDFQAQMQEQFQVQNAADVEKLSPDDQAKLEAARAKLRAMEPPASVADFIDHIDHAVKIAGIDHVGIASDFDGGGGIVGWQDASETQNVTEELLRRGYSEGDIAKIWGGNLLRVMAAAQAAAKQ